MEAEKARCLFGFADLAGPGIGVPARGGSTERDPSRRIVERNLETKDK